MVFLDVVYNHFGPAGNYLHAYAETFFTERHQTPWGAGINFDGARGAPGARLLRPQRALLARGVSTSTACASTPCTRSSTTASRTSSPRSPSAARAALPGPRRSISCWRTTPTRRAGSRATQDGRAALHTAQWNDDLHHCWHVLLTGEADGYYEDYADAPVARLGALPRRGLRLPGRALARIAAASRAASRRRTCRRPPSSPSCRTTTRSATAPSASGSSQLAPPGAAGARARRPAAVAADPDAVHGRGMGGLDAVPVLRRFRRRPGAVARRARRAAAGVRALHGLRRAARRAPDPRPDGRGDLRARRVLDWAERRRAPHARGAGRDARACSRSAQAEVVPLTQDRASSAPTATAAPRRARRRLALRGRHAALRRQFRRRRAAFDASRPATRVIWVEPRARPRRRDCAPAALDRRLPEERGRDERRDADCRPSPRSSASRAATPTSSGARSRSPLETRRAILAAFGLAAGSDGERARQPRAGRALRGGLVPRARPARGRAARRAFRCARAGTPTARGASSTRAARVREGRAASPATAATLALPRARAGLSPACASTAGGASGEATLIAAPARCWQPRALARRRRGSGASPAQLYGLRSARQSRHRRLSPTSARPRPRRRRARRVVPRPQPGARAVRGRPRQDLALFAVLAPVPRDAASSTRRGAGLRRQRGRRRLARRTSARAHRRAARGARSSTTPASGTC